MGGDLLAQYFMLRLSLAGLRSPGCSQQARGAEAATASAVAQDGTDLS